MGAKGPASRQLLMPLGGLGTTEHGRNGPLNVWFSGTNFKTTDGWGRVFGSTRIVRICGIHGWSWDAAPLNEKAKSLLCGSLLWTRSLTLAGGSVFTPRCYCRSWARCAHYSSGQGGKRHTVLYTSPCPYLTALGNLERRVRTRRVSCYSSTGLLWLQESIAGVWSPVWPGTGHHLGEPSLP